VKFIDRGKSGRPGVRHASKLRIEQMGTSRMRPLGLPCIWPSPPRSYFRPKRQGKDKNNAIKPCA
jgi:hypothetical protein